MRPLTMKAVRHYMRHNDQAGTQKRLDAYITSQQPMYARYGGDSAIAVQRQDLAAIAAEAARGGLASLALDYLGRMADMPSGRQAEPRAARAVVAHPRGAGANAGRTSIRFVARLDFADRKPQCRSTGCGLCGRRHSPPRISRRPPRHCQ